MISAPVPCAKNLLGNVDVVFSKFIENNRQEPVRIVFGGDKGGNSTKFHFSFVAPGVTTSAYHVKIIVIQEAADSCNSMWKVLHPFYNTIKDAISGLCLRGSQRIKVFQNRDCNYLDHLLGHNGSGARYQVENGTRSILSLLLSQMDVLRTSVRHTK